MRVSEESIHLANESNDGGHLWYALRVRPRHEKVVAQILAYKGFDSFLPTYRSTHRSARPTFSELPMVPGYVFCRFDARTPFLVVSTAGVLYIVGAGRSPIPVSSAEIASLRAAVASGLPARPCPYLPVGQRVRIDSGPFRDLEGILVRTKNLTEVVVSVTLLQRSVGVAIGRENVCPVLIPTKPRSLAYSAPTRRSA